MTNKYPGNTTCEICGKIGRIANADGWVTCPEHSKSVRPAAPLFAWDTGEVYDPEVVIRPWEKFLERPEGEPISPDQGAAD